MNYFLFSLGLGITLITIYDMVYTILSPTGAGLIANRVSRGIWRLTLKSTNYNGHNKFLSYVGPMLLLIIVLTWIILLWFGNTMIVFSDSTALWSGDKNAFIDGLSESAYFIAYVLSSMGNGDYTPASDWWMFYTGFISYTGVVFISLGISFLIPVIEAITLKRKISLKINNLGNSPKAIINNYKQKNFTKLTNELRDLESSLISISQNHLAYPIIHYFHSEKLYEALPIQLASLDEALSIIIYEIDKEKIDDFETIERLYKANTYYLSTLASAFIHPEDDEPVRPDTKYLNDIKHQKEINDELNSKLSLRRKLLLAYLQNDGWEWDILGKSKNIELKESI